VATLKIGLILLGVAEPAAEKIATHYAVLLDTVDEVVGNQLIFKGKALSAEEIATIYALNYVKLVIDLIADEVLGRMKTASNNGVKLLLSQLSVSQVNDLLKGTIDRAYIHAPGGPTLAPSHSALTKAFMDELEAMVKNKQEIAQAGWDNPVFVGWFADTAFESVNMLTTSKVTGGRLPSLSTKKN